jgi:transposase
MSKTQGARLDFWRQLIAKQQQSGMPVGAFCQQQRTSEYSFYHWRKRLAGQLPMKFALVETQRTTAMTVAAVEVMLTTGDVAAGVERIARATMIHLPASVRVYLATSPCDMRRSFDGLHALVNAVMQLDAFGGHLFVFANRRRDRVKILYWDRDGFAVWAKRLEEGTYAMPFGDEPERRREITVQELGALLSGIDLSQAKRRKRYDRKSAEGS